jgi:transcriptional regulator with XRE-family HTH domain
MTAIAVLCRQIDKLVGGNIRAQRLRRGLSQSELGEAIGVTFQQVQKYEKGTNRVPAGRLWQIAHALGAPVSTFFEGLDGHDALMREPMPRPSIKQQRDLTRLILAFGRIDDAKLRRAVLYLLEGIAPRRDNHKKIA